MSETMERLDGSNLAGNALPDYQTQLAAMGFGSGISLDLAPLCFWKCSSQKASIPLHGCVYVALQLGQRYLHKILLGKTFGLPPAILTLFLSPLGFSHCGFVLELGDLIILLAEPKHQSFVSWRACCSF